MGTRRLTKSLDPRSKQIEAKCLYCSITFYESPQSYNKKQRHFCSHKCYCKYREDIMQPHEQPTWRGGITRATQVGRGNKKYKEWMRAVLQRDKCCVWCSSTEKLEADHVKRWSTHPELRYEITNGRTLCMKCHNKTRNKKFYENPELVN